MPRSHRPPFSASRMKFVRDNGTTADAERVFGFYLKNLLKDYERVSAKSDTIKFNRREVLDALAAIIEKEKDNGV